MATKGVKTGPRAVRRGSRAARFHPTREVILDTAEQLFAARGVDGVAVRDLARVMGLTAPSLYNHFRSKQALYDAVLERGLRPVVEILGEAWHPGALRPERMRVAVGKLTAHLAAHPHLGRLLQRALLEEDKDIRALVSRWIGPVYRQGIALIRETAGAAGWEPAVLPHLAMGLFGIVFSYFINTAVVEAFMSSPGGPLSDRAVATQRQFVQEAIYRMLGPQAGAKRSLARRQRDSKSRRAGNRR